MDFDPRNEPTRWGAHAGFQLPWKTWRIVSVIGVGSFGTVYEVAKIGGAFDERCAVKHISLPQAQTDIAEGFRQGRYTSDSGAVLFYQKAKERIINEIQLMQRFAGHSHIVNYHDYEIVQKPDAIGYDIFIRMDLLHSLSDHLKSIPADQMETAVAGLGRDICDGLRAIHRRNILHRDIKPANILYGETGYKLADFGVAKSLDVTGSVTTAGTQNYMSPELYKHQEGVNQTSDIYSLGIVMYRLLNGNRLPFLPADPAVVIDSDMESEALGRRMRGETVAPIGGVNPELMHIIQKACSYHSMDRYQSADEMAAALDQYQRAKEERPSSSLATGQSEKRVKAEGNHDAQVAGTGDVLETTVAVQNSGSLPVGEIQRNDPLMPASAKMEALNLPPHDGGGVHAAYTATQRDAQEGPTRHQTGATGAASSGATVSAAAEGARDAMRAGARLAVQLEGVLHKAEGNELEQLAEDGDSIVYAVSVTNEGNDGVYVLHPYFEDQRLNDALPANRAFRLEPGQHWTAEASLRLTREDVGKPEILQTVTASGKDSHGTIITAQGHHAARTVKSAFKGDRKISIGRALLIVALMAAVIGLFKVIDANLWRPVIGSGSNSPGITDSPPPTTSDTLTDTPTDTPTDTSTDTATPTPTDTLSTVVATPDENDLGYHFVWPGTSIETYKISIRPVGSPRDMINGEVKGTSCNVEALLPDTQYTIKVVNTANAQENWTTEIITDKAKKYSNFGVNGSLMELLYTPHDDQGDKTFDHLQSLTNTKINSDNFDAIFTTLPQKDVYLYLSWSYRLASTAHQMNISCFLQTPSGEIYQNSCVQSCGAAVANTEWNYYHSINDMLQIFHNYHPSIEKGTYTFQVYFDKYFFDKIYVTFNKKADTPTPSQTPSPTPTLSPTPVSSSINSLELKPDANALSCQVEWKDDTTGLSYEIALRPLGAPRDCFSTVVSTKSFTLENLLPDSEYSVTVTETKSRRNVTTVLQTGSVETYHVYHAVPNMANLLFITNEDMAAADNNTFKADYHKIETIQADDIPAVYSQAFYYVYLKWTYAVKSESHTTDMLFFLQTPENELYYQKYTQDFDETLQPRIFWRWYANVNDVINAWRTDHPQIAKGTYKIWVYFDNLFFRTNEFVVE